MSGGSHNYLYSRVPDEIGIAITGIEGMAEALRPAYPMAAWHTDNVARLLREARAQAEKLADLWHAQEWFQSGDWSPAAVRHEAQKLGEPLRPCEHSERRLTIGREGRFMTCETCGDDQPAASP